MTYDVSTRAITPEETKVARQVEYIVLKHHMNVIWASRPLPEDRPADAELFGEVYNGPRF